MAKYRLDGIEMPDGNEFEIPVFVAEYSVTPYEEILDAFNAGRALICKYQSAIYVLDYMDGGFSFARNTAQSRLWVDVYIDEETGATVWTNGNDNSNAYPAIAVSPSSSYYLTIATTDSLIRRSTVQFGSSTTKYLANNGTWQNIPSANDIFWCTYGTTTSAEIEAAITAGKLPCVKYNDYTYTLRYRNSATNHRFVCMYGGSERQIVCQSGTWITNATQTFLTSYAETDPTVPSWAKQNTKPSYTASEVGAIAAPSSPATGSFLVWDGLAWVAQTLSTWQGGNY